MEFLLASLARSGQVFSKKCPSSLAFKNDVLHQYDVLFNRFLASGVWGREFIEVFKERRIKAFVDVAEDVWYESLASGEV